MTAYNGSSLTYNANGGVSSYDGWDYTWSKGKLSTISKILSGTSRALISPVFMPSKTYSYSYNGYGQRVGKSYSYILGASGLTDVYRGIPIGYDKKFYYDQSGRLIAENSVNRYYNEMDETDHIVYLYDDAGVVGMAYIKNGVRSEYYFLKNLQGDVVEIYDTIGAKVAGYTYDAWGNCTITSDTTNYTVAHANPFRYRSYYYDSDTNLYYLNARYYSPELRRFISPDDTSYLEPKNVNGCNLYCYCNNDPVNYCDPSGHFPWLILAAALLLITPVGGTVLQVAVSTVTYVGVVAVSLVDEKVKNDMDKIGWNPFNSDANAVLNSQCVSFYKGVPVFRFKEGRSGSFGAIFLAEGQYDESGDWVPTTADDLKHERGHNSQLMMMGIATYGFTVGIPSPLTLGGYYDRNHYHDAPWEAMANIMGGTTHLFKEPESYQRAWDYYWKSLLFFPSVVSYW